MKYAKRVLLPFLILCLVPLFPPAVSAQNAGPEQKQQPALYILSKTDMSGVRDPELQDVYREAEASLLEQIRDGLSSRDIKTDVVKSEQEIAGDNTRFILVVKIDKIELGRKRPFGRTAKVKVGYAVQNKDRFEFIRRTQEVTSAQKWQNCIKSISEQVVADTANDIAKKTAPAADDKQVGSKQAPAGPQAEARLQQLENLKAKGLITEKEYQAKKKEILNEL